MTALTHLIDLLCYQAVKNPGHGFRRVLITDNADTMFMDEAAMAEFGLTATARRA